MSTLPAKAPKTPSISRKVRAAMELMLSGEAKTQKDAAEKVGLARETLSRALSQPHVIEEMKRRIERMLGGATLAKASGVLNRLLDAESEHVRLKAAEMVLGIAGFRPPPPAVLINHFSGPPGWVIDLTDPAATSGPPTIDGTAVTITIDPEGTAP